MVGGDEYIMLPCADKVRNDCLSFLKYGYGPIHLPDDSTKKWHVARCRYITLAHERRWQERLKVKATMNEYRKKYSNKFILEEWICKPSESNTLFMIMKVWTGRPSWQLLFGNVRNERETTVETVRVHTIFLEVSWWSFVTLDVHSIHGFVSKTVE